MGVNVKVGKGVSVAGGGVPLGTRVTTRGGATVGGVGEANGPHDCKKTIKIVKSQLRKTGFRVFLQKKLPRVNGHSIDGRAIERFPDGF